MDIVGILTVIGFVLVGAWQFGEWVYKKYISIFVKHVLCRHKMPHDTNIMGIDYSPLPLPLKTKNNDENVYADYGGVSAPSPKSPDDTPLDWSYRDTNYPSDEVITLNDQPLSIGDFIIAQKSCYCRGKRDISWMNEAIQVIAILPAHVVLHDKHTKQHQFPNIIMMKSEFFARDFRHLAEAEKKYFTW